MAKLTSSRKRQIKRAQESLGELTHFDIATLDFLGRFGCGSLDQIREYAKKSNKSISENRLRLMQKAGYLKFPPKKEDREKIYLDNKEIEIFRLDKIGEDYCENVNTKPRCTIYTSSKFKHDYRHVEAILNEAKSEGGRFTLEDIKEHYRCENELQKGSSGSSRTDGFLDFKDSRGKVFIETITQHYKIEQIQAKELYVEQQQGTLIAFKVEV